MEKKFEKNFEKNFVKSFEKNSEKNFENNFEKSSEKNSEKNFKIILKKILKILQKKFEKILKNFDKNFLSSATTIDSIVWKEAICASYSNVQNKVEFSVERSQVRVRIFPRIVHSPKFTKFPKSAFARINSQNFLSIELETFQKFENLI